MKIRIFAPILSLALIAARTHAADPLPSWKDAAPKRAIIAFVEKVTNSVETRIGTLKFFDGSSGQGHRAEGL
ncbi:MAG TPA: hypothetical protein VIS96_06110 [Terrimicrobiaceae bacterium]